MIKNKVSTSFLDANVCDCIFYILMKLYPGWKVFFELEIHSVSLTMAF